MLQRLQSSIFFQNKIYHASAFCEVVIFKFGRVFKIDSFRCIIVHKTFEQAPKIYWFHGVGGAPRSLAGTSFW